jgi:hypothetical protein
MLQHRVVQAKVSTKRINAQRDRLVTFISEMCFTGGGDSLSQFQKLSISLVDPSI